MDPQATNPQGEPQQANASQETKGTEAQPAEATTPTNTATTAPADQPASSQAPDTTVSTNSQTAMQTPTASTVSSQPATQNTATKEKKSKSWIIVLVIILIILALLFGIAFWIYKKVTGTVGGLFAEFSSIIKEEDNNGSEGGSGNSGNGTAGGKGTVQPADNPIIEANNKMRNELSNFSYTATITTTAMGMDLDTFMDCTYDSVNKIEHCETELPMGLYQESYYDYANGYEYSKMVSPYSFAQVDEGWTKTAITNGSSAAMDISNGTTFSDIQSEAVENGTKYTGKIGGFYIPDNETNEITNSPMSFEIIVNNDGYLDSMTTELSASNITQSVDIQYSDYDAAGTLSIPEEALNS